MRFMVKTVRAFNSLFGIQIEYDVRVGPGNMPFQLPFRDSVISRACAHRIPYPLSTPFSGFCRQNMNIRHRSRAFNSLFGILREWRRSSGDQVLSTPFSGFFFTTVMVWAVSISFNSLFGILCMTGRFTGEVGNLSTPFSGFIVRRLTAVPQL